MHATDISEGKFSFPILYAIQARPNDTRIISILRQRTRDASLIAYCIAHLEEQGAFSHTKHVLANLYATIQVQIAQLDGGNEQLARAVAAMADGVV